MAVETVPGNGIDIAYETFGDPADPAMVLVMGLGTQMLAWPDSMCEDLAEAGHFVVRFDNRDVGLSTHLHGVKAPPPTAILTGRADPPYTIADMARDTLALCDAIGIRRAHLVGASMGGFIAQTVALQRPDRIRSLTLIMTSTGSKRVGNPRPTLIGNLTRRRSVTDRAQAQAAALATFRAIGSPGFPFDEEYVFDLAGRSYDRSYDPAGYLRQLAAILAQPNRTPQLRRLSVPSLVIHGLHDPLVAPSGGLALARHLPDAKFVGYAGMGHDLPRALWPEYVREISGLAQRADLPPA